MESAYHIIWVDSNNGNEEHASYINQLKQQFKQVNPLFSVEEYKEFVFQQNLLRSENKYFLIVSGRLGEEITLLAMKQHFVVGIFVFCQDIKRNIQWANNYQKVKAVKSFFTEIFEKMINFESNQLPQPIKSENENLLYSLLDIKDNQQMLQFLLFNFFSKLIGNLTFIEEDSIIKDYKEIATEFIKQSKKTDELKQLDLFIQTLVKQNNTLELFLKDSYHRNLIQDVLTKQNPVEIYQIKAILSMLTNEIKKLAPFSKQELLCYSQSTTQTEILKFKVGNYIWLSSFNIFKSFQNQQQQKLGQSLVQLIIEIDCGQISQISPVFLNDNRIILPFNSLLLIKSIKNTPNQVIIKTELQSSNQLIEQSNIYMKKLAQIYQEIIQKQSKISLQFAEGLLQNGKYQEALKLLNCSTQSPTSNAIKFELLSKAKEQEGQYEEAKEFKEKYFKVSVFGRKNLRPSTIKYHLSIISSNLLLGIIKKEKEILQEIINIDQNNVQALFLFAKTTWLIDEFHEALSFLMKAEQLCSFKNEGISIQYAEILNLMGIIKLELFDVTNGKSLITKALEISQQLLGDKNYLSIQILSNLGLSLLNSNEIELSQKTLKQCQTLCLGQIEDMHPIMAQIQENFGILYSKLEQKENADNSFLIANLIYSKLGNGNHYLRKLQNTEKRYRSRFD